MGGVTNFLSIVEARSLGTADVDKMTAAIDKQSTALDNLGKSGTKVNEHPGFNAFAEKVKQGIENPLGAAGAAAEGFLNKLGPVGAGVAAVASSFAAATVAGLAFARELGALGDSIGDTSVRMGLSIKQTGDFQFAMKYAGGTMDSLEGIMRKLSAEIDSGGTNLKGLGVAFRDVTTGDVLPMNDVILQLAQRLNAIPDVAHRNAEAIKIMGRSALAVLPDLLELPKAMERAGQLNLAPNAEQIARWHRYLKQVVELDAEWEKLKRDLKDPIAGTVLFSVRWLRTAGSAASGLQDAALQSLFGGTPKDIDSEMDETGGWGYGGSMSRAARARAAASVARNDAANKALVYGSDPEGQLAAAKKALADAEASLPYGVSQGAGDAARKVVSDALAQVKALEAQIKATKDLEAAQKALLELQKNANEAYARAVAGDQSSPERKYQAALAVIGLKRDDFLTRYPQSSIRDSALGAFKVEESAAATVRRDELQKVLDEGERLGAESVKQLLATLDKLASDTAKLGADFYREHPEFFGSGPARVGPPAGYVSPEQELRDARSRERRNLALYGGEAALAGVSEINQAYGAELLRKRAADEEYAALKRAADLKHDEQALQDAVDQQHQKYLDAELERQQALLQMALRQKQEFQNLAVGGLDALISGNGRGFLKSTGLNFVNQVFGNFAGEAWKDISKVIPHSNSKYLQGTLFAADPMQQAGVTLLTAGAKLDLAASKLLALDPSSGGGGYSSAASTFARIAAMGGGGFAPGVNPDNLDQVTPEGAAWADNWWASGASGGISPWARGLGIGGAAVGSAFGMYSGIRQGGARGGLTAAGSGVAGAAAILSLAIPSIAKTLGPIGMLAGMGLGLLTSALPDPKQVRDAEQTARLNAARYTAPTASNYTRDRYGRDFDYDTGGGLRPIIVVSMPVDAIDSRDLADRAPHLVDMVTTALENQTPRLAAAVRNTVRAR